MTGYVNDHDSLQLTQLRDETRRLRPGWNATATLMGRVARDRGMTITDFGTHSKRWRRAFDQAYRIGLRP